MLAFPRLHRHSNRTATATAPPQQPYRHSNRTATATAPPQQPYRHNNAQPYSSRIGTRLSS